jgi:hypothetical protein
LNDAVLVEREHSMARLTALLDEAAAGSGRLVLLGGEAGVGKTSVAGALAAAAAGRLAVRRGACDSVGPAAALGPLVDAVPELSEVIEHAADVDRLRLFRRLRGVLVADGDGWTFRHELARRAVEQTLSPVTRMDLHGRALRALPATEEADDRRLTRHAAGSGDRDAVLLHAPSAAARPAAVQPRQSLPADRPGARGVAAARRRALQRPGGRAAVPVGEDGRAPRVLGAAQARGADEVADGGRGAAPPHRRPGRRGRQ